MPALRELHDNYAGERIFLIGNGPSLQETPLDLLADEFSLGMKKINHIYEQTDWRPTFYLNPRENLPPKQCRFIRENIEIGVTSFINSVNSERFGENENVYYIDRHELKSEPLDPESGLHAKDLDGIKAESLEDSRRYWSDDPSDILYTYHSMFGAFQLAAYLGFDEIYLVGCDLGYEYHDPHMVFGGGLDPMDYSDGPLEFLLSGAPGFLRDCVRERNLLKSLVNASAFTLFLTPLASLYIRFTASLMDSDDPNHFSSTYRIKPKDNRYANDQIRKSHIVAKRVLDDKGIDVYNATVGGELEVYPRVDLTQVV